MVTPEIDASGDAGEELAAAALETICPIDDVRASAEYRREMVRVLTDRAIRQALQLARTEQGKSA